jgi:hypothetical protein
MLKVSSRTHGDVYLRPSPLVSISNTLLKNKVGTLGSTYNITLNGNIVVPYGIRQANRLTYIIDQQRYIREVFGEDGQKIELGVPSGVGYGTSIRMFPNITSINFPEGQYIDICPYSISLETPFLFDANNNVLPEGMIGNFSPKQYSTQREAFTKNYNIDTVNNLISEWGGLVDDFSDSWSIESDDSYADTKENYSQWNPSTVNPLYDTDSDILVPRSYRLTRNMSATGKTFYASGVGGLVRYEGIDQAFKFIQKTLLCENNLNDPSTNQYHSTNGNQKYLLYPGFRKDATIPHTNNVFSSGFLNLPNYYKGFNHLRTVNYDRTAGSCSVTDSWILSSGTNALENYVISIDNSNDNIRKTVKINGNIKGLSDIPASGYQEYNYNNANTPYKGALNKYHQITNSGKFGLTSAIFKRAKYMASGVNLNSQPLSLSLATNELTGEITYSADFDDRPLNYFSGVLAENITINDTYPGDIFALIPVIGRSAGPVIQYIRSRTEYKRDVNIEVLLDYTDMAMPSGYGSDSFNINADRTKLLLTKPSLNNPFRENLRQLVIALSPSGDPNVNQFFLNPPQETWSPKEGRYTLSLQWNYEKNL